MAKTYYVPVPKRRPDRGNRLDRKVLKQIIILGLTLGPAGLEKKLNVSHGLAVRIKPKAEKLGLTLEKVEAMRSNQLYDLWYSFGRGKRSKDD